MAAFLYSWQFPHFHALSWNIRPEYSRAGYRMISILNPRICTSSSLNHTIALGIMCSYLAPVLELTTWNFAIDSLLFNLYFLCCMCWSDACVGFVYVSYLNLKTASGIFVQSECVAHRGEATRRDVQCNKYIPFESKILWYHVNICT